MAQAPTILTIRGDGPVTDIEEARRAVREFDIEIIEACAQEGNWRANLPADMQTAHDQAGGIFARSSYNHVIFSQV